MPYQRKEVNMKNQPEDKMTAGRRSLRLFEEMKKSRLIAFLSPKRAEQCLSAYRICREEGVVLEIAFRSLWAEKGIKAVLQAHPEALILAGTVLTKAQAQAAIGAGAAGVVSADYIPDVVDICVEEDVMCVPGGLSDVGKQLVRKAAGYGCTLDELKKRYPYQWIYKLFPAFSGKTSHLMLVSAWSGPFKDVQFVYTGGLTRETLPRAVLSNPRGIFCGSELMQFPDDPKKTRDEILAWKNILNPGRTAVPVKKTSPVLGISPGRPRVVCFGEIMGRLSPPSGERLQRAGRLDLHFGGAEANVAVSLAGFGMDVVFVSTLPNNDLGENALSSLRSFGVDTGCIIRKGQRLGIYYLEHGSGPRPSKVVYDRAGSSASEMGPGDFDWESILENAAWFHWTGITPALGPNVADCLKEALAVAAARRIPVSVDLNFRSKLWSSDEARDVMSPLMSFVNVCLGNEEDATRIFGIEAGKTDVESGHLDAEGYKKLTQDLKKMFGFQKVAVTLRESLSASENNWSACLLNEKEFLATSPIRVRITDRVGSGDAFAAGLIFGILSGKTDEDALRFGVAAACLKHSIKGDFNLVSADEVNRLASGDKSGRVQR